MRVWSIRECINASSLSRVQTAAPFTVRLTLSVVHSAAWSQINGGGTDSYTDTDDRNMIPTGVAGRSYARGILIA